MRLCVKILFWSGVKFYNLIQFSTIIIGIWVDEVPIRAIVIYYTISPTNESNESYVKEHGEDLWILRQIYYVLG